MATVTQIADLRKMVNEPTTAVYSDQYLSDLIDASANSSAAAVVIWDQKAARYAELVNVKEGNSSRDLGDLYDQALSMSKHYSDASEAISGGTRKSRTRPIDRA
jgi:hypothetical protein